MKGAIFSMLAITLVLAGCDGRQALAEKAVREALNDPDSARFGETLVYGTKDNLLACGTVNAKNRFGGYVGDHPFMIYQRRIYLGTDDTSVAISSCCHRLYRESVVADGKPISQETSQICSERGEALTVFLGH